MTCAEIVKNREEGGGDNGGIKCLSENFYTCNRTHKRMGGNHKQIIINKIKVYFYVLTVI